MPKIRLHFAAVALIALAIWPALESGFLADDFYMGQAILARRSADPSIFAAFQDAFVHRWASEFDVFRPLTILSLELDYALFGANARAHHATNMVLWLLAALLFSRCALQLVAKPRFWHGPLFTLLFGICPAGIEVLGWIIAREDLFLALFALLALDAVLRRAHGFRVAACLVPAFLAKETAIVLPPLLAWTDAFLGSCGQRGQRNRKFFSQHAPPLLLLIAYFVLRVFLFGRMGGTYNGRPYTEYLSSPGIFGHVVSSVAECLLRLLAPINHSASLRITGLPPWVFVALAITAIGLTALAVFPKGRPGDVLRAGVAGIAWMVGPLALLVVPLEAIGPDLDKARFLLLPMIGLLLPFAAAVATVRHPRLLIATTVTLTLIGIFFWRVNLKAYSDTSSEAQRIVAEALVHLETRTPAYLLGAEPLGLDSGLDPSLIHQEGVHFLSAGLFNAVGPPFVRAPGFQLLPLTPPEIPKLLALSQAPSQDLPTLLRYRRSSPSQPQGIELLAKGGPRGRDVWGPEPGSALSAEGPLRFRVSRPGLSKAPWKRMVLKLPTGESAVATQRRTDTATEVEDLPVEFLESEFQVFSGTGQQLPFPLSLPMLQAVGSPVILGWIEQGDEKSSEIASPYVVWGIPKSKT